MFLLVMSKQVSFALACVCVRACVKVCEFVFLCCAREQKAFVGF